MGKRVVQVVVVVVGKRVVQASGALWDLDPAMQWQLSLEARTLKIKIYNAPPLHLADVTLKLL